jgi:hypothetical protein
MSQPAPTSTRAVINMAGVKENMVQQQLNPNQLAAGQCLPEACMCNVWNIGRNLQK